MNAFAPSSAPPPAEALRVRTEQRIVNGEFSFDLFAAEEPSAQLCDVELVFPGFQPTAPLQPLPAGGCRGRGRLTGPGWFPFEARASLGGRILRGRDFFLARETKLAPQLSNSEIGYYFFLGCGDYPLITGQETHRIAALGLDAWRDLISQMADLGMNRLWVLLNGYTLAYPSARYPELRDPHARNVADNFLRALIDHGHTRGVRTTLMLTADGHARAFSRAWPETARRDASGQPCHHFGLALEHPRTRRYMFDVLDEALTLYPNADGVAVHPTESDPERFNPESLVAFQAETGGDLRTTPPVERRVWHNRTYARFLCEFGERAHAHNSALDLVMANCWWQDDYAAIYHAELPTAWRICVWHYAWEDQAPTAWPIYRWREAFGSARLLYMPTSQSYLYPDDPARVMDRHIGTDRLISTAAELGVRPTVYFAGWDAMDESARWLDAQLARHPTGGPIGLLYADYFAARSRQLTLTNGSSIAATARENH